MIAALTPTTTKIMNQSCVGWSVVKFFLFIAAYDSLRAFFSFAHRAWAAFRAASFRCSGVRFLAVACPPLQPNATKYFENSLFLVIMLLTSSAAAHIVITKKWAVQVL